MADTTMQYGGWYDNPATGKNQRYWGNGVWTDGAEPGASPSASSSPAASISIPRLENIDYGAVVKQANDLFGGVTADSEKSLQGVADNVGTHAQEKSNAIMDLAPTIKDMYTNLAAQLEMSYQDESNTAKGEKSAAIGTQKANAAAQGFNSTSGFEAAQTRNTETYYDKQIADIATKWGLKKEQLAQETTKSLKDLVVEAKDALLQGDTQQAQIIGEIANLRVQQANIIKDAANNIAYFKTEIAKANQSAAGTEAELKLKAEEQAAAIASQQKLDDLKQKEFELSAQKAAGTGSSDASQLLSLFSSLGLFGSPTTTTTPTTASKPPITQAIVSNSMDDFTSFMNKTAPGYADRNSTAALKSVLDGVKVDLSGITGKNNPNALQIGK